jgi:DNA primase
MPLPPLQIHDDIPTWLDAINRRIDMIGLLEHYGINGPFVSKDKNILIGPCPLHHGRETNEFYVYANQNRWACYGSCHRGGTPLDFVALKEGVSLLVAAMVIQSWYSLVPSNLGIEAGDT